MSSFMMRHFQNFEFTVDNLFRRRRRVEVSFSLWLLTEH